MYRDQHVERYLEKTDQLPGTICGAMDGVILGVDSPVYVAGKIHEYLEDDGFTERPEPYSFADTMIRGRRDQRKHMDRSYSLGRTLGAVAGISSHVALWPVPLAAATFYEIGDHVLPDDYLEQDLALDADEVEEYDW